MRKMSLACFLASPEAAPVILKAGLAPIPAVAGASR